MGRFDIVSSISRHTTFFKHKYWIKQELISFLCSSSNWTNNFLFPAIACTYPNTSFPVLLLLLSLVFPSISPNFAFTTDPTPIFVLVHFFSIIYCAIVTTGDLTVELGGGLAISVSNIKFDVDLFFVWKLIPTKNRSQQSIVWALSMKNSSLDESNHAIPQAPHSLTYQKYHLFKILNSLTYVYIFKFITGLKNIKLLVKS